MGRFLEQNEMALTEVYKYSVLASYSGGGGEDCLQFSASMGDVLGLFPGKQ